MNTILRTIVSLTILGVGVGGFLWLGEPQVNKRPPQKPAPPVVELISVASHEEGFEFEVDGVVVPFRQIQIAAQVNGKVEYKAEACRVGRAVKKDDLLVRIEQRDYAIDLKRIREEVKQAKASLAELHAETQAVENQIASARLQLEIDTRNLARSSDLVAKKITSAAEMDDAKKLELISQNALQALIDQKSLLTTRRSRIESQIALGEANLERAQLSLDRTVIRAPIDGIIVSENVEQDGFVQTGSPVIAIQDTSQLDIACKLHMKQMHWLWQAQGQEGTDFPVTPAKIVYELEGTAFEWDGIVNRLDGAGVDNQTRMVPCLVNVSNPTQSSAPMDGVETYARPPALMTGMFVKVRVQAKPPIPLVAIPQSAVQPGNTVWINKQGVLSKKQISIVTVLKSRVLVIEQEDGLMSGDQVVVSPLATPYEGQRVLDSKDLAGDSSQTTSQRKPSTATPPSTPRSGRRNNEINHSCIHNQQCRTQSLYGCSDGCGFLVPKESPSRIVS